MKISVVICTRNRPDTVGQAVESVAECDYPTFDLHIMDQSTDTQTRDIVQALAKRFEAKLRINYHHLDKAGLSRAYNAGIKVSDGEIIACTDDDVVVPKNWLREIARAFTADPSAGLLYGQVLIPESLKDAEKEGIVVPSMLIERHERLAKDGQRFKIFGMGANMAIRRAKLEKIGLFDEALGGGGPLRSSQDFDFSYRTYLSGAAVLLVPAVKVDHYGSRTADQWPATMKAYGIGDGAFYSKHIRCGDTFALWMLTKKLSRYVARQAYHLLWNRVWKEDVYTPSMFIGMRDGAKFDIDKKWRVYRESERGKMTVTDANAVTGVQRSRENSSN
ncbi:MAG TPA: glycosyltransferase family A protein [Polyangiaceae bacterium]|nr:glycosyltransferase family A protein [Polyangiaceae bacterium]